MHPNSPRQLHLWVFAIILAISTGLIWYANTLGLWYVTWLAGLVLAGLPVRTQTVILCSLGTALVGWAMPLVWLDISLPIRRTAAVVSAVMGFGTSAWWLVDVITCLTGILLAVAGTYLGRSLLSLVWQHAPWMKEAHVPPTDSSECLPASYDHNPPTSS
ncbi:hypothetical protein GCM10025857_26810 [Alicyclobacillus contaminans]|uniref:hypothetical protein n=1 Tax=Alicyclobacillus contaminans TaxID=392016 RepID=UPI00041861B3|nr:hypothetical protein [Alicyclobacillus contaminans]GMA51324.1 hypothetical protein GCM10025857_26810 [Alicyclobacillus contaminans]